MKFKELREKYRSKFPASLVAAAVKIALDMGGNMTGAYKKIEAMKRGLANDPMVKDALKLANEDVQEGMSPADKKKRLELIKKAVEKLNAKNDAKAKADFLKQMKDMVDEEVLNELKFSYAFFDKADLNKYMTKALKLKGLTVVDSEKQAGGHYTVRVQADDKKIIAKSNSLALQAMSESVEENYAQID